MNKSTEDNRKLWTNGLRSGEFKQCKGVLESVNIKSGLIGNCCLGVACRIFERETGEKLEVRQDPTMGRTKAIVFKDGESNETTSFLPLIVADWLGVQNTTITNSLMKMNDQGKNFANIATFIENLPAEKWESSSSN